MRGGGVSCFMKQLGSVPEIEDSQAVALSRQWADEGIKGRRFTGRGNGTFVINLRDPKGGDPAEWPEDLRVREFPAPC